MKQFGYGIFAVALLCSLVVILAGSAPQDVSAQAFRSEAVDLLAAGGSCGGSCGPGDCDFSNGETRQDNCTSCSGVTKSSKCNCKGKYQCYNKQGVQVKNEKCTGSCSWTAGKSVDSPEMELKSLWESDSNTDPIRSPISGW